jgi:ribonuclease III
MKIFDKIDVNPTNINLYMEAVTHSSYTNENPSYPDYERLEFLGDAVLEITISDYLYKERKLEEGVMTRMRASYVCEEACATYAKELELDKDIKIGSGEAINDTILADVFEAFVAALYLDQGFEFTKKFVLDIITRYIEKGITFLHDYKSTLQELVQTVKKSVIYEVVEETGPSHNKSFTSVVKIDGIIMGKGTAGSKKASEQEAARVALSKQSKIK